MKLFKDSQHKEEVEIFDLGVVLAGEKKEYSYYVYNDVKSELVNLKFIIPNDEIKIVSSPEKLQYKESGVLKFIWSPSVTLKSGLKTTLKVEGFELYS